MNVVDLTVSRTIPARDGLLGTLSATVTTSCELTTIMEIEIGIWYSFFSSTHMKRTSATVLYPAPREPPTALSIASNRACCCNGFLRLATSPL